MLTGNGWRNDEKEQMHTHYMIYIYIYNVICIETCNHMNHASVQLEQLTPLHPCGTPKYPNQPWILLYFSYITIIALTIIISNTII